MYLEKTMTLRVDGLVDGLNKSEKIAFEKGEGGNVFISINGAKEMVSADKFKEILDDLYEFVGER